MEFEEKSGRLVHIVRDLGSVLVAYSGGTDSAYLAYVAHQVLGASMLAVIADSPSLPRSELAAALAFASKHEIPIRVLTTNEMDDPNYQRNDSQRCFFCKDELFRTMEDARANLGFAHLAYGMNMDDGAEFRPGHKAAALHDAVAPLAEAALTKQEIRSLAAAAGLALWDKPASACLASRIEYGRPVTRENLSQVERAESALRALGISQLRVRSHGNLARVEIAREELESMLSLAMLDHITAALRAVGFIYVTLDTHGYRSGSMNDMLAAAEIAPAPKSHG